MSTTRALGLLILVLLTAAPPISAGSGRQMEIVSELGKKAAVKIYSGESLTFRVREKQEGLTGLFSGGAYLYEITFELREWPKLKQDQIALIKGANRRIVREQEPEEELWGLPPSSFTIEGGPAGRYRLTASKPGYPPVEVLVNIASFNLRNIDGVLDECSYRARFDVELTDPDEQGRSIPLLLESLDDQGRVVDMRKDLVLAPVNLEGHEYRSSRRPLISSHAIEPFMNRLKRREQEPLPEGFFERTPLRIVEGGMLRISFRNLQAVYPLPLGF
jgi:hypothetical protein